MTEICETPNLLSGDPCLRVLDHPGPCLTDADDAWWEDRLHDDAEPTTTIDLTVVFHIDLTFPPSVACDPDAIEAAVKNAKAEWERLLRHTGEHWTEGVEAIVRVTGAEAT